MREITELEKLLLVQAFDGRPMHFQRISGYPNWVITVDHENGRHKVQMDVGEEDLELLVRDLDGFRRTIAKPIMHNLDSAAYPERWERLLPTFKRAAELMADGRSAR